jgi:tRNA-dihydrouridine synthase
VDGFMVARGIMNNPWLFSGRKRKEISPEEKKEILLKHLKLFEKTWESTKPFNSQKKYVKAYVSGFDGANELRKELMAATTTEEVVKILDNFC